MNTIFKYNANAKYSTKDLKGAYNSNNVSLLDVYLDEIYVYQTSLKITTLWQNQGLQRTLMNGHYLLSFGENFIIAMVNKSLN